MSDPTPSSTSGAPQPPADGQPVADLLPLVYDQLRAIAMERMAAERPGHTLQATALVHETYMRLAAAGTPWTSRGAFFFAAAEAMRRILIEHARRRGAVKRGGERARVDLPSVLDLAVSPVPEQIVAFDDALLRLEAEDEQAATIVRLRFFAGLTAEDTAAALGISPRSVVRGWAFARAWLWRALKDGED